MEQEFKKPFIVFDTLSNEMIEADTIEEAEDIQKEVIDDIIDQEARGFHVYIFEIKRTARVSLSAVYI